ncbi:hypothetical protein P1X15_15800 [Runella sp. MFBS21]|uniref:hypothetical protein n=1 Tax=Runella sp. MFBS21 TaxID=3034018 RepID=UPI0023FA05E6|nr:hypothetical protein [Runella sp. MFBS21]MDF7819082.1 hypothetical protein [Runella sp. MFBS21]
MKRSQLSSFLLLLFASLIIVSCSKKEDPEPSLADQVAGNYTATSLGFSGISVPLPFTDPTDGVTISGKIEIKKVTDDTVDGKLILIYKEPTGQPEEDPADLKGISLKKATNGEIEAYAGTTKVGTYANNELKLSINDADLGVVTITGKK